MASRRRRTDGVHFSPASSRIAPSGARPLSVSVYDPLSGLCHGLHRMGENADRGVVNAGRGTEQNHSVLCAEFGRRLCHGLLRRQLLAKATMAASGVAS